MTFISYAINSEDVLLWRALGTLKQGFYIDFGVCDIHSGSCTKAFYDAGWHGVNLLPEHCLQANYANLRERDVFLVASGESEYHRQIRYVASDVQNQQCFSGQSHLVTLNDVFEAIQQTPVHFLRIDPSQFRAQALCALNLTKSRPWIILLKTHYTSGFAGQRDDWIALIESHDYTCAYFDGVNRFYVAREQSHLSAKLALQANLTDDYIGHREFEAIEQAKKACEETGFALENVRYTKEILEKSENRAMHFEAQLAAAKVQMHELEVASLLASHRAFLSESELQNTQYELTQLQLQLQNIYASSSWRISRPVRVLRALLDKLRKPASQSVNQSNFQHEHSSEVLSELKPELQTNNLSLTEESSVRGASIEAESSGFQNLHQKIDEHAHVNAPATQHSQSEADASSQDNAEPVDTMQASGLAQSLKNSEVLFASERLSASERKILSNLQLGCRPLNSGNSFNSIK